MSSFSRVFPFRSGLAVRGWGPGSGTRIPRVSRLSSSSGKVIFNPSAFLSGGTEEIDPQRGSTRRRRCRSSSFSALIKHPTKVLHHISLNKRNASEEALSGSISVTCLLDYCTCKSHSKFHYRYRYTVLWHWPNLTIWCEMLQTAMRRTNLAFLHLPRCQHTGYWHNLLWCSCLATQAAQVLENFKAQKTKRKNLTKLCKVV